MPQMLSRYYKCCEREKLTLTVSRSFELAVGLTIRLHLCLDAGLMVRFLAKAIQLTCMNRVRQRSTESRVFFP